MEAWTLLKFLNMKSTFFFLVWVLYRLDPPLSFTSGVIFHSDNKLVELSISEFTCKLTPRGESF
jgi:hypothetical protein